jgi:hypothetical protein
MALVCGFNAGHINRGDIVDGLAAKYSPMSARLVLSAVALRSRWTALVSVGAC